jgi:hypothetical protein
MTTLYDNIGRRSWRLRVGPKRGAGTGSYSWRRPRGTVTRLPVSDTMF